MMTSRAARALVFSTTVSLLGRASRQFSFPPLLRTLAEVVMFCGVFLAASYISLGNSWSEMRGPMVPVVLAMLLSHVASGVYRRDINHSIMNLFIHSAYGFALAIVTLLPLVVWVLPAEYASSRFMVFFLFFGFFVTNTVRPLISGTDFNDGGGRRNN